MELDPVSLRVLGSLMEKEMTTPDLYPLSVNSLVAAASQRSSREPVMTLSDEDVRAALDFLESQELVVPAREAGRVARFEHRIRTVLQLRRDENAVLCLLLLRGPQTPGELRSRSDRMFSFDDLAQVQSTLERLAGREEPLVVALARQPGSREVRWVHRLGGNPAGQTAAHPATRTDASAFVAPAANAEELAELRASIAALEARVLALEEATPPQS